MKVNCNGKSMTLAESATVADLIAELNPQSDTLAVAVNHTIIPQPDWANHGLRSDDNVDVFTLVAGG
ncbi:sulfur carrier protein ThiS [Alteromonas sp. 14N.309.X.WAT.G.H12]|uniref:sulfur carrier protein ThiS n=1 Tax=Alteromonas sp. 14N.309.X.WAT.G.H12 TaxID=3120824 RepID=UPI002FD1A3EA